MFSPATKKSSSAARKNVGIRRDYDSVLLESRSPLQDSPTVPNRPASGTPAPWSSRLSVIARMPVKKSDKEAEIDAISPVFVGEFPKVVRDAQDILLQNHASDDPSNSGGIDKETSLAWIICGKRLFMWNCLSPTAFIGCVELELPSTILEGGNVGKYSSNSSNWLICVVNWNNAKRTAGNVIPQSSSAGIVIFNKKTCRLAFWPDIYNANRFSPVTSAVLHEESEFTNYGTENSNKPLPQSKLYINSLIASPIPGTIHSCIALACSSEGKLWGFLCSPSGIHCKSIKEIFRQESKNSAPGLSKGYPRSIMWHPFTKLFDKPYRQFLLLTNHEIQCFEVKLSSEFNMSKLWSHEIIGNDADLGIQKDLAGQKRIWPLDLDVDSDGKVMTVLIAIYCKDRVTSSSYTEYSLLTMQYKSGVDIAKPTGGNVLEKKAPIQVIVPKARVEDEDFLLSMRLKVGGKPDGSAIILSSDGTATVSHYWRNSTKLYQFDLPYDAGKVLDASVFPSLEDSKDGAWAVLTEKAGVWVIPERAVLLGGVEPPERSLSRKGSSNDRSLQEERRNIAAGGNIVPRRASSEAWNAGDRQRPSLTGAALRSPQDEDSEALLFQLFHEFLLSGQADGVLDKLNNSKAFEREGEINIFVRASKSIVDTLAKHWTSSRGPEIVVSVVSSQLVEKQNKHQKFLQFLALSKCHEELCSRQRQSLQIIMEHGEKLAGMIRLRELQNTISQSDATGFGLYSGSDTRISGALWDLIQLVGERARRNTVLLMDRDNAEVFYSKVSDLEEIFHCLERQLDFVISVEMPSLVQFQRACEISNACVTIFHAAMQYRSENDIWYPPPEGLTPWCSKLIIPRGLWSISSFMLQLLNETNRLDDSARLDFFSNLELLSEVLLECYSGAITAKAERKEEYKTLLEEYWNRRDALLNSLYQQIILFFEATIQNSTEQNKEQKVILTEVSSRLLSVAKRHGGYQTMWDICSNLNDSELLRTLMHESMGPKGGFCWFVFKKLYDSEQLSKLMRLGEEFQEELASFLTEHPNLRWLHEMFLHQFSSASETLHSLSLSTDYVSPSSTENIESCGSTCRLTLANRKHYLNLAKISAMAGRNFGWEVKMKRIEADLNILQLQEEILRLLHDTEERQSIGNKLLPPVDIIELCLKMENPDLSLHAFDIFAWTSASFLRSNTTLLEKCWRNAASQDDWGRLHQMSVTEGWSDETTIQTLRRTVLFQASNKCYGPESQAFEVRFDEVLPLRQQSSELSSLKDTNSSVEAVLMQHEYFPDAGKLMLSAVMLGSDWDATNPGTSAALIDH
ncbi:hypothetical protein F511_22924 [Dorcoceras hygrometricum]|uniref:Nucleoporin Nup133/Nup155-like N-terminal domain-containing protein n=1 Tax=Dorcoceras hygrometricum TaxID=472368 RepID=A0A2Z7C897_9LAMI|nr:hypothetical protein F511_22924 [Dorcoceras hygrometricum]